MSTLPPWHAALSLTAGPANVNTVDHVIVCTPESEEQAAEIIRFAGSHRLALLPRGHGTGWQIGAPPPPEALVLSTKKLARLIDHEPADMVATVQAGMALKDFQTALNQRGQWLPLDSIPDSSIGGLIATNRSGIFAHGYGTLRDMVIGMRVINGDGVIRKCGGKVVKNVTGYDLGKLYIGSLGTLALITEVTFKLRPLPIERDGWKITVAGFDSGVDLLRKIAAKNLPLEALQLVSADLLSDLFTSLESKSPLQVLVVAAGTTVELDRIDRELSELVVQPQSVARARIPPTAAPVQPVRNTHSGFGMVRFWSPSSRLKQTLETLLPRNLQDCSVSVGVSGGEVNVPLNDARAKAISEELGSAAVNFRFEDLREVNFAPGVGLFGPSKQGAAAAERALMQRIKSELDPQNILNPGRSPILNIN